MPDFFNENGCVILVDKPLKWTSFDVVNKIRYAGKFKKVGHAGTLDPLATGLLILCAGKKTKEIELYQAQEKEYIGKFILGFTTPSLDLETAVDAEFPVDHITEAMMVKAKEKLTGTINQAPPIFSAIRVGGKRAYESARKGESLELKEREVVVSNFSIDTNNFPEIAFTINCSKGTYIRSLVRDFGILVDSGAYLSELRRTKIGEYNVANAADVLELADQITKKRESIS